MGRVVDVHLSQINCHLVMNGGLVLIGQRERCRHSLCKTKLKEAEPLAFDKAPFAPDVTSQWVYRA